MNRGVLFQYFEWNCRADGSLWRQLARHASELAELGATAIWLPPCYKGFAGPTETGYGAYDLYDLGEFDQKGTTRTKYGTRDELLAAIAAIHEAGMHAYADVVFNHRMGGDHTEEVEIEEIAQDDRNLVETAPYTIKAWSHYQFPGRSGKHSAFEWHWWHFNAFGCNADAPEESKIFRVAGKTFSGEVSFELGNFDYLMGANVDHYHEEVREELFAWGRWFLDTTQVDGFRLDAIKHIPASFYRDWFNHMRTHFGDRELFGVGEYWSANLEELEGYLSATDGAMRLFDVPLHFNFVAASQQGSEFDLSRIFEGTLVGQNPLAAVTFVDNHDSQPGQSLESWVQDWFKPLAYALILLRRDGYPCVFYGDYLGNDDEPHRLTSHRRLIDVFLRLRASHSHGDQHDHFDHPSCIGWVWSGNAEHPTSMAVLISTAEAGSKRMKTFHGRRTYRDVTGHCPDPIETSEDGEGDFVCPPGQVSVWCME